MVEHDVLALEGRRLKGSLVAAAQEIAGLENRKAQLRFSMEERKQEIQVPALLLLFCMLASVFQDNDCVIIHIKGDMWWISYVLCMYMEVYALQNCMLQCQCAQKRSWLARQCITLHLSDAISPQCTYASTVPVHIQNVG